MSIDGNDTDKEVDLLNMNNESEKDKNLFGDNNDNNDNNDVFGNYEDDKDGQNDRRGEFLDGKWHGKGKEYYQNGKLKFRGEFKDGHKIKNKNKT